MSSVIFTLTVIFPFYFIDLIYIKLAGIMYHYSLYQRTQNPLHPIARGECVPRPSGGHWVLVIDL